MDLYKTNYIACLEQLNAFKIFLEKRGVSIKNTRIERYIKFFETLIERNSEFDPQIIFKNIKHFPGEHFVDWMLYIIREVNEIKWIYSSINNALKRNRRTIGLEARLLQIIKGADITALDKNSYSRNIQFELRIASYFLNAGYDVDLSEQTDIIAKRNSYTFYLECKRIENSKKIEKRLNSAAEQLSKIQTLKTNKYKTYKIIAVDLTKVAFPHEGVSFGFSLEMNKSHIQTKLINSMNNINTNDYFDDSTLMIWSQIHFSGLVLLPQPQYTSRFSNVLHPNENKFKMGTNPYKLIDAVIKTANTA